MNKHDKKYLQTALDAERQIDDIYSGLAKDLAGLVVVTDVGGEFLFSKNPILNSRADELVNKARIRLNLIIRSTTETVWGISNDKNDELVKERFSSPPKAYTLRNEEALRSFQDRKISGLKLSDRVWRRTDGLKNELETAIDAALSKGKSAAELSRDIRKYLINPDLKFRRIRDKYGKLIPSKVASEYHPGQGVYRSSYQNALRLARNEINKAYRKADWLRWSQLDFVIGYKIIPSLRSATVCPICNALQGIYPKWFVFTGWHVSCRCTAVPILCSDAEFEQLQMFILKGENLPKFKQPPLPGNFTEHYTKVKEKYSKTDTSKLPDWIVDNQKWFKYV